MHSDSTTHVEGDEIDAHPLSDEHGEPEQPHLPPSSIWPITMAAGLTTAGAGLVTTFPAALGGGVIWPISVVGILMMITALVGWIQELRHEPH